MLLLLKMLKNSGTIQNWWADASLRKPCPGYYDSVVLTGVTENSEGTKSGSGMNSRDGH